MSDRGEIAVPLLLECVEVRGRARGGNSKPLLVQAIASDDQRHDVVLKVRKPDGTGHFEGTSLACELIAAMLGQYLGLSVPPYAIVNVSPALVRAIRDRKDAALLGENLGLNFGSVFINRCSTWTPRPSVKESLRMQLESVLCFDSSIINGDRTSIKPNLIYNGEQLYIIDHALAIPVHQWSDEEIDQSPLFPDGYIRNHCSFMSLLKKQITFENFFHQWRTKVDSNVLVQIRKHIPKSWEQHPGHLDSIFKFLQGRDARTEEQRVEIVRVTS